MTAAVRGLEMLAAAAAAVRGLGGLAPVVTLGQVKVVEGLVLAAQVAEGLVSAVLVVEGWAMVVTDKVRAAAA